MRFVAIGCFWCGALAAVATAAVSGLAATAPGIEGTARHEVLLLTKTCDASGCTVVTSSSGPLPVGSHISYFGPLLENRTTSRIRVTTPAGDTADGHCSLSYKSGEGTCVITGGTGELAGLHANLRVSSDFSSDPAGVFTWEGPYHFE